ncbi:PREDICTED: pentatricopeptide repeat-containing protein At5g19020, mitochondrial-like [Nelumbo nucifera]|uniref:Pentatricopeptide repeat-containing protein At5g19020, mitochondrial n=2 Tax=Nelumbo nucifera TaxID=4432 RepID=A0A822YSK4_NELNU|nr:PREDICTED: pentatricopeptide repeat-containing protein At5g19020, mitochondrial-like [Nelumbo nucifera]DAD32208.1 TPA_asm: hypothetical protein HUJ06_011059 [Nelumbo nucifera]
MKQIHNVVLRHLSPKLVSTNLRQKQHRSSESIKDHLRLFFDAWTASDRTTCGFALVWALKSCSSLLAISQGEQIHSFVLKSGFDSNIFIQNSLINVYAKCGRVESARSMFNHCSLLSTASWNIMIAGYVKLGRVEDARRLFEAMPGRDCVSFTTMIMGFAQNDHFLEALIAFSQMRTEGVTPNEKTLASVISAYSHLIGLRDGYTLHAMAIKLGLEAHVLVSTNLVHMYSMCSNIADAELVFVDMPERNIVSWNVMLIGYSKAGLVHLARNLFENMPVRDQFSWDAMVNGYLKVDWLNEALVAYIEMLHAGFGPNEVMIVNMLSACGRAAAINGGGQFHSAIIKTGLDSYVFMQATIIHFYAACHMIDLACLQFKLGSEDNVSSWNALIAGFVRNNMVDSARKLFNEMPERDVFSWSSMIAGYAQNKQSDMALELFHEMLISGVQPNEITMVSVLSAIATSGTLEQAGWADDYINNSFIPLNDNLIAALIDMYAKCGSNERALEIFSQIQHKVSTISPWNAIICGTAMHGHGEMSLKLFSDLLRTGIKPNSITFIGVLSACCHAGLVDAGKWCFECMKKVYDIDPDIKHYGCMVDLLGRAGCLEEAKQLVESMPMKADVVIWGTLLAAARTHGNVEIGERAAEMLAKLEPDHGAGRVMLSNIYADVGRWDDVFLVRRSVQSERMKKLPGCSSVV